MSLFPNRIALILGPEESSLTQRVFQIVSPLFNDVVFVPHSACIGDIFQKISLTPTVILGIHQRDSQTESKFLSNCKDLLSSRVPIIIISDADDNDFRTWALSQGVLDVYTIEIAEKKLEDTLYELLFVPDPRSLSGKLLCVEDSTTQQKIIAKFLQESNLDVVFTNDVNKAIQELKDKNFDLILVDFLLPGELTGLDLIKYLRKQVKDYDIPIIVMTAFGDEKRKEICLRSGADGFLIKPFTKEELLFTIKNLLQRYLRTKDLMREIEYLREKAIKDPLTGAYNRSILELIVTEIERAYVRERKESNLSLFMFDIDDFKKINDIYGHIFGDFVLKTIAEIVNQKIRKTDYCIRYGGEEFLVLLMGCDVNEAYLKADEVRKEIESAKPNNIVVTVSIGVSGGKVGNFDELKKIIDRADVALYRAKRGGKNRVEILL